MRNLLQILGALVAFIGLCVRSDVDSEFRKRAEANYKKIEPCLKNAWIYAVKGHNVSFEFPKDAREHFADIKNRMKHFKHTARVHSYRKYFGPWVENIFISHFENRPLEDFHGIIPLFVPWVDNQKIEEKVWRDIMDALKGVLRPSVIYLAVSQGDIGLAKIAETFPNILVLSGGGFGHVPIPLIKGEIPYHQLKTPVKWDQEIGFFGNMQQASRPIMFDIIRTTADSLGVSHKIAFGPTWIEMMSKSKYNLAPRGFGRSSFRFAEAIQIGRVPAFLYDDVPWIPYLGSEISVETYGFAAGVNATNEADRLPALVAKFKALSDEDYMRLHKKVQEVRVHFTYPGVMHQIEMFVRDPFGPDGGHLRCTPAHPSQEHAILRR